MKIAYILFDGITMLDFIGIYDPVSRLQSMNFMEIHWDICAMSPSIKDSFGLETVTPNVQNDLSGYDAIIIPGGFGTRILMDNVPFIQWLQTASDTAYKISICTGSLLLGAAGFLKDKQATTHFDNYETLKPFCKTVLKKRIVEDGNVITAGAVASSPDLGLFLCEKWINTEVRQIIQKRMDYFYKNPTEKQPI